MGGASGGAGSPFVSLCFLAFCFRFCSHFRWLSPIAGCHEALILFDCSVASACGARGLGYIADLFNESGFVALRKVLCPEMRPQQAFI